MCYCERAMSLILVLFEKAKSQIGIIGNPNTMVHFCLNFCTSFGFLEL